MTFFARVTENGDPMWSQSASTGSVFTLGLSGQRYRHRLDGHRGRRDRDRPEYRARTGGTLRSARNASPGSRGDGRLHAGEGRR